MFEVASTMFLYYVPVSHKCVVIERNKTRITANLTHWDILLSKPYKNHLMAVTCIFVLDYNCTFLVLAQTVKC